MGYASPVETGFDVLPASVQSSRPPLETKTSCDPFGENVAGPRRP